MNNDDKIREMINKEPVPDSLKPENIKKMLDEQAPKKKRSGIKLAGRITAAAAACTVIGGTAVYSLNNRNNNKYTDKEITVTEPATVQDIINTTTDQEAKKQASYMSGASDYEQVYTMFKKSYSKAERESRRNRYKYEDMVEEAVADEAEAPASFDGASVGATGAEVPVYSTNGDEELSINTNSPQTSGEPATAPAAELPTEAEVEPATSSEEPDTETATAAVEPEESDPEHSDTYNQEQDVLEADIVKTDGKHIYYISNTSREYFYYPTLYVANAENGKFTHSFSININESLGVSDEHSTNIRDMYIYNDMIIVIGTDSTYNQSTHTTSGYTFAAFFTTGDEPELIDVYKQDGYFNDVRISPEGYMLLISDYSTCSFDIVENCEDTIHYIPRYGFKKNYDVIAAEDILLPECGFGSSYYLSYSVIGSVDLNKSGEPKACDIKTLAGYSGSVYCSANNLYTATTRYDDENGDYNTSDITRISIAGGAIVPEAGGIIKGYVKDQFSMSEYNGYFRVAATYSEQKKTFYKYNDDDMTFLEDIWGTITGDEDGYYTYENVKTDTHVYVMDMDMNLVGEVGDLGVGEQLKSASFSGDMAYIVTFRQTDPLYAVDLSNPAEPVVLDELKINGFSTYMQSWGDGLLLGFGQDADDNGRITGLRLTMFDNSDPNNLKAADVFTWNNDYDNNYDGVSSTTSKWYNSTAVWERKALLIAPEKNLIGVPIEMSIEDYNEDYGWKASMVSQYVFFSFEDGKFVEKGDISENWNYDDDEPYIYNKTGFDRAIYIGDYVYALSNSKFVAAAIDTLEVTDELVF
ncbi:beta-propeller domain-containing protein [Ruminococcus sp.]|uniref:beta-propeller domain-containing protein n=1 Tax=Ruminococcus sp. TaxID=41978 RepID=UPI0025E10C90|nr:beta-propeller domain-containing protein [Ruminococcus sp.]